MKIINKMINFIRIYKIGNGFNYLGKKPYFGKFSTFVGKKYINIGNNFSSGFYTQIQAWNVNTVYEPSIEIGDNVSAMNNFHISCINKVVIESGCLFGDNVLITDNMHGSNSVDEMSLPPNERELYSKGPVYIGKNVWIGRNVCIFSGVSIGDGAVVGANSIVTSDVADWTIVAGAPARVISEIT